VDLTNEDVADILALLDSLPYDSLDLETSRFRLTLRRAPGGWTEESRVLTEPAVLAGPSDAAPGGPALAGTVTSAAADTGSPAAQGSHPAVADGLAAVSAPLPGTFYRAPRPGADPFVQVGDLVAPDTVVAIIETMKLMNPVHAGTAGRVARISVGNGDFAPLGATLLLIEPA
jgi:acetyl-CoA carboxylase biotin carboxyl carrier protein